MEEKGRKREREKKENERRRKRKKREKERVKRGRNHETAMDLPRPCENYIKPLSSLQAMAPKNTPKATREEARQGTSTITPEKLTHYFTITGEAIIAVQKAGFDIARKSEAEDFLDMASRYYSDARHFESKKDSVNAFACLNYAHGWLDAGARIGLFKVHDSRLFTVDD